MSTFRAQFLEPTDKSGSNFDFRLNQFLHALLIHDRCNIDSVRLLEFPKLVNFFGIGAVTDLLESGLISVDYSPGGIGNVRRAVTDSSDIALKLVRIAAKDTEEQVHRQFADYPAQLEKTYHYKNLARLKRAVVNSRVASSPNRFATALKETVESLRIDSLMLRRSLSEQVKIAYQVEIEPAMIQVHLDRVNGGELHLATNLKNFVGVDEKSLFDVHQEAVLRIARFHSHLELQKELDVTMGMALSDLAVVDAKYGNLIERVGGASSSRGLAKLISVAELPNLENLAREGLMDLDRFIDLIQSPEIGEFRSALPKLAQMSEREIHDIFGSLSSRLSSAYHSVGGKLARFAFVTMSEIVFPSGGVSCALGLLDEFWLSRIVKANPVVTVADQLYRLRTD